MSAAYAGHVQEGALRLRYRDGVPAELLESGRQYTVTVDMRAIAYRLRRAAELIGHDVDEPESWLTLHLALRALDVLEASGVDRQ